ncbi:two-component system response regulator [Vibrio breoganii]|uniref:Two-component system response regulator n=1 Tax=Vibrio breoganii TaxID=553239 RepID=A0AAN0XXM9_9VIBR|nr:two-component system response regulator [Vibrio breoganii]ANO34545.1 two-component system response regulator [Vibrio breoganii]OED89812.1 two-component system response regulator [Vibrio breoganii ZF-55]PMO35276.1 two-component system response regulator [Vibrio breoganii]
MADNKQTILIVDDTPANIDVLAGTFQDKYRIKVANSGKLAIKIAQMTPAPDIILLDIMMPEMDGYEVCSILKSQPNTEHIPIIFVTAKITAEDEIKGFQLGAVDYITKPITPLIAIQRVKTHLALANQNRELYLKVKEQTDEINQTKLEVIQRLGRAAEYKDNETGLHVQRMAHYCHLLAIATGMNEADADLLRDAAPMHDIGKIGIPDGILLKDDKLTAEEWEVMKTHVNIGGDILYGSNNSAVLQLAHTVAMTHHEKFNGKGYPAGISGEDIPLVGRISAIADVFDALTSPRPYKKAWDTEDAFQLLVDERGEHFDPKLVDIFLEHKQQILEIKQRLADS